MMTSAMKWLKAATTPTVSKAATILLISIVDMPHPP
jgi:hypothetical protein